MTTIYAVAITEHTLVGVCESKFPKEWGNCFSVRTATNLHLRIVNFAYENLEEALRLEHITWPVKIVPLSDRVAIIHDERIPDNWYSDRFCEVCCPRELLPQPQLLAHARQIARGDREERDGSVSMKYPGLHWD